ncbi:DUF975 family protein [Lactobacillus sp. PV012]|uniref:DUF975 family protein n=1 Tax=Lactobacillus sp. PV012 TaxID=2594494 RepID=UPI00223F5086|nr:DUF975 family protein [Lactobacillus sp. PV012]QNQ82295.1 DUF975 family protein [Lactobacillus sp. PV012]
MKFSTLKKNAKSQLRGDWGWAILVPLVNSIFAGVIGIVSNPSYFIGFSNGFLGQAPKESALLSSTSSTVALSSIVVGMLSYSIYYAYLNLVDTEQAGNVFTGAFAAVTNKRIIPSLLTSFLASVFIALWSMLFIIPGIIKSYAYSMAPYIIKDLTDNGNEVQPTQAIRLSRQVMKGHKWQLFCLDLSFIGWFLLSIITCGIGFLWLRPYFGVTRANYYRQLVGDHFQKSNFA